MDTLIQRYPKKRKKERKKEKAPFLFIIREYLTNYFSENM